MGCCQRILSGRGCCLLFPPTAPLESWQGVGGKLAGGPVRLKLAPPMLSGAYFRPIITGDKFQGGGEVQIYKPPKRTPGNKHRQNGEGVPQPSHVAQKGTGLDPTLWAERRTVLRPTPSGRPATGPNAREVTRWLQAVGQGMRESSLPPDHLGANGAKLIGAYNLQLLFVVLCPDP